MHPSGASFFLHTCADFWQKSWFGSSIDKGDIACALCKHWRALLWGRICICFCCSQGNFHTPWWCFCVLSWFLLKLAPSDLPSFGGTVEFLLAV